MVYGYENEEGKFKELDRTEKLTSVQGLLRAEYATDMNERYINKWRASTQLNLGLTGFGSLQLALTRTIIEWFSVSLAANYFWTGVEFQDNSIPDNPSSYLWEPGWYVNPYISIYF